ncbi:putative GAF sensor protein [uncultured Desulfobacterium sp.]|uniref:Putative GAF sensor protein n=1 Tax=uncultured Desulfobacterium sp. TaxID=201089 RepID=A0A445MQY5_9BACT|nr:putative GAF sensor protein [uncultured Desulfobacterium sp.]
MNKKIINYETLIKITKAISHSRDPEEVMLMTVENIKNALDVKACALFLINRKTNELEVAASHGLSDRYLNKGPLSFLRSITQTIKDGPIAIYDVTDDPRIQYPDEAKKEGIASILSVPIVIHDKHIGILRVYTSEPWEFTMEDVIFVQALAQLAGIAIEMTKLYQGQKEAIDILKLMRDRKQVRTTRRTPYESVPISFTSVARPKRAVS